MSSLPHLPDIKEDDQYPHIRSLIANIHRPRNTTRPPLRFDELSPPLEVVKESPTSSDTEQSVSGSEKDCLEKVTASPVPGYRVKSNSIAGVGLAPPLVLRHKRRRPSALLLSMGHGGDHHGPASAGTHLSVPKFTVTAPPGEHRRHSHAFTSFHGFALRRHSNTVCVVCGLCVAARCQPLSIIMFLI